VINLFVFGFALTADLDSQMMGLRWESLASQLWVWIVDQVTSNTQEGGELCSLKNDLK